MAAVGATHSTCGSTHRSTWRRRALIGSLAPPPPLFEFTADDAPAPPKSDQEKLDNLFGRHAKAAGNIGTIKHQKNVGQTGSKTRNRLNLYDTLALGGSTIAELKGNGDLMRLVYGLSFCLWNEYTERLMWDRRWCGAFAEASAHVARNCTSASRPGTAPVVCVVGLGSAVTALGAAKAGANVVWLERVMRFVELAKSLAARNGLEQRIRHARATRWEEFVPSSKDGGDARHQCARLNPTPCMPLESFFAFGCT